MKIRHWIYRKFAIRSKNVSLGRNFHVGPFSRIWAPNNLKISDDVYIGKFVTLECDGTIGNGVLIANSVGIVGKHDHDTTEIGVLIRNSKWIGHSKGNDSKVIIESDVWIGYGAVILAPVIIGHSAIVAAGSVVTKDVAPFSIVAGNPAKIVGKRFSSSEERIQHASELRKQGHI